MTDLSQVKSVLVNISKPYGLKKKNSNNSFKWLCFSRVHKASSSLKPNTSHLLPHVWKIFVTALPHKEEQWSHVETNQQE